MPVTVADQGKRPAAVRARRPGSASSLRRGDQTDRPTTRHPVRRRFSGELLNGAGFGVLSGKRDDSDGVSCETAAPPAIYDSRSRDEAPTGARQTELIVPAEQPKCE
ncbi:hypothetical protein GCM10023319_77310 [Nocardia iowensis]